MKKTLTAGYSSADAPADRTGVSAQQKEDLDQAVKIVTWGQGEVLEADKKKKKKKEKLKKAILELSKNHPELSIIQIAEAFIKSIGHKYIKRTGVSGSFKYWYRNPKTGELYEGKKPTEKKKPKTVVVGKKVGTETYVQYDAIVDGRSNLDEKSVTQVNKLKSKLSSDYKFDFVAFNRKDGSARFMKMSSLWDAHPVVAASKKVDAEGNVKDGSLNNQIYHRMETMVSPKHPSYPYHKAVTNFEMSVGALGPFEGKGGKTPNGYLNVWKEQLASKGIKYEDLVKQQNAFKDALEGKNKNDLWAIPEQSVSSGATSINSGKLAALFNQAKWESGTKNLDLGGGKFDNQTEYLKSKGVNSRVYDPFNRPIDYNADTVKEYANGQSDTVTLANVLNVIPEQENQEKVLRQAENALKDGGKVYITTYVDAKIESGETSAGYQHHQDLTKYLPMVQRVFSDAKTQGGMIVATKGGMGKAQTITDFMKANIPQGQWGEFLAKAKLGSVKAGHLYHHREMKNGKWVYFYKDPKTGEVYVQGEQDKTKKPKKQEDKKNPKKKKPEDQKGAKKEAKEEGPNTLRESVDSLPLDPNQITPEMAMSQAEYSDIKGQMGRNLEKISEGEDAKKPEKVSGKLNSESRKLINKNMKGEFKKYVKYLASDCVNGMRDYIEGASDVLKNKDGSLDDIDAGELNGLMIDNIQKIIHQEVESNRQQFTDHGIRHIIGNIKIQKEFLKAIDPKQTDKQMLMAQFIMVNHDIGYTTPLVRRGGMRGITMSGMHTVFSEKIAAQQKSMWNENKIFSSREYDEMVKVIRNHDNGEIDFDKPLQTTTALADNLALFASEKLPAVFARVDNGKAMLLKMGEAARDKNEILFNKHRDSLYAEIDNTNLNENLKRDLKMSCREITMMTPKFTLGVMAGELQSIEMKDKQVHVKIKYNEFDSFLQKYFDMGQKQTRKFLKEYGIEDYSKSEYNLGDKVILHIEDAPKKAKKDDMKKAELRERLYDMMKARVDHKYIKRTGTSGNYRYWYEEEKNKRKFNETESEKAIRRVNFLAKKLGVNIESIDIINERKLLRLDDPMQVELIKEGGYTESEVEDGKQRGEQFAITGEHQLYVKENGQRWSTIRLYDGYTPNDIYHEFAHAVAEQGGAETKDKEKFARKVSTLLEEFESHTSMIEKFKEGIKYNQSVYLNGGAYAIDPSIRTFEQTKKDLQEANGKTHWVSGGELKKYFGDLDNVGRLVVANRGLLDYNPSEQFSALKSNSDPQYHKSLDFTTSCSKRYIMQSTIDAIQVKLGRPLNSKEIMDIREIMGKRGIVTSCGACYVDSRRINQGTVLNKAIAKFCYGIPLKDPVGEKKKANLSASVKDMVKEFKEKGVWKKSQKATLKFLEGNKEHSELVGKYKAALAERKKLGSVSYSKAEILKEIAKKRQEGAKPELSQDYFLTYDGLDLLAKDHPATYKEFRTLFAGTQIKIPEARTEYRGEIAKLSKEDVNKFNGASGLRWQSWSDFEVPHLLDSMQAIGDMASVGLAGHAYTKQENFVRAMASTGIMINMSLIPKGDGFDKDGNVLFDESQSFPLDRVDEFRSEFNNVGTVAIGISDKHIKALLADPRIDFVIPYHSSGLSSTFREKVGMEQWTDYSKGTEFRDATTGGERDDKIFIADFDGDMSRFKSLLKEKNLVPPFKKMLDWPGYEKLITDRRVYGNDGSFVKQNPVAPTFNGSVLTEMVQSFRGIDKEANAEVIDDFLKTHKSQTRAANKELFKSILKQTHKYYPGICYNDVVLIATEVYGKQLEKAKKKNFAFEDAIEIGDKMGLDWSKYDKKEFHMGLNVELEHGKINRETDVTHDNNVKTAKIALAHLNEMSDYYTKLADMENK